MTDGIIEAPCTDKCVMVVYGVERRDRCVMQIYKAVQKEECDHVSL